MASLRFLVLALVLAGCGSEGGEPAAETKAPRERAAARAKRGGARAAPEPVAPVQDLTANVDPSVDGWDTEVFNAAASGQLKLLAARLEGADEEGELFAPGFMASELHPADLAAVYTAGDVTVFRPDELPGDVEAGGERLLALGPYGHVKFKVLDLEVDGERIRTRLRVLADGDGYQVNADWLCTWVPSEAPLLERIELERYEELRSSSGALFEDCTRSVLGANACFEPQLLENLERWLGEVQAGVFIAFQGHQGMAVGDVNGDGLDDLYACQPGGLPNLLFVQNADGSATDRSAEAGVDFLDNSQSALLIDLDADGDQDLVVGLTPDLVFLSNDGRGRFSVLRTLRTSDVYSLAAADYDEDGDLDLYACAYVEPASAEALPTPYHDANNGRPNLLLQNEGGFAFSNVTEEVGLDANNRRFSFAASWEDYDDDGDLDLYVANDFGRNNLYRNDGGHFVDVAGEAGVEDISAGMGVTWGDYDGDGAMDVYVSNMFSSAGNRIAYQRQFQQDLDAETRGQFQRHARGNSLFRNLGDGTFADVSEDAGVTMGRWAWGSKFVDLNSDGRLDLVVPNGFATSEDPQDL
jgi:hypothetical protein